MSNIFTVNPIKVNRISIKNAIIQTTVFIGVVPSNVRNELEKIQKTSNKKIGKNKILSNFYGKSWPTKLGLSHSVLGGAADEFSFDADDEIVEQAIAEISEETSETPEELHSTESELKKLVNIEPKQDIVLANEDMSNEMDKGDVMQLDDIISLDDLTPNSFERSSSIAPVHAENYTGRLDTSEKIAQITKTEHDNLNVQFVFSDPFLSVYPEDKILEFKKKLYVVLNIPIFRQHIWYVYQGRSFPLSYSVFEHNSLLYVNVQRMLNYYNDTKQTPDLIENIPICIKYYQMKNALKVVTNDTFSILSEYYHKYGITEYNLLDLGDFIDPSRTTLQKVVSERYQLELIYYSFIMIYWPMLSLDAFLEYVKSETNIQKFYPDLMETREELSCRYKLEKKIADTKFDLISNPAKSEDLKKIRGTITNSIVSSVISVLKYQSSKDVILFIRNLFDKFPLSDNIPSCKCHTEYNGKKTLLNKVYKTHAFIKEDVELNSIMFKVKVPNSIKMISLSIYTNGNYVIRATWSEEKQYDFDDIFDIVRNLTQPIIESINTFGAYVLTNKKTIPIINKNNSKFTEIGMSMFYKKAFTDEQFDKLKSIMSDYQKAGIVRSRSIEKNNAEYYFSKGMYQFNAERIERVINLNNYYNFMTDGTIKQKWFTIFEKTRITKLFHRFADVKIEILGIKENEFFIFYNYMMTLFDIYQSQERVSKKPKQHDENVKKMHERRLKKTLKNLKEQDPVLYKFRKHYKTENVYSKICQKRYQPLLLTKQGYDQLPKNQQKNSVKYWNFTTNKDAYYICPNPKYPYVRFTVKRHPNDYCFPCCKKLQVSDDLTDAKRIIHDICIKDHKYTKESRTITMGSRYIMAYGKDVEPGRLSKLPENSLEPMFYETFSINDQGVDSECVSSDGYYMYGVEQVINGIDHVGIMSVLINALETSLPDFITNIIKVVKLNPSKFKILLNGSIDKYFVNVASFISSLTSLFLEPANAVKDISEDVPWNDIFINIAYLFLNINVIYFRHVSRSDDVKLMLPSYISDKEQFLSVEFKNIIIIQKKNKFYPIYLLNTDLFFKSKIFSKKTFRSDDSIIIIIGRLVESYFADRVKKKIMDTINLSVIQRFVKNSTYTLKKIFVNNANRCYYVHLNSNARHDIFMPIELSYHLKTEHVEITYDMFQRNKHTISIETMQKFMRDFNRWIAEESEKAGMSITDTQHKNLPIEDRVQPIYPYIKIHNWLVLTTVGARLTKNSTVIGFTSHNMHYYVKNIKLAQALLAKNAKIIEIYYDPDLVNRQIFAKSKPLVDKRCLQIGKSIYESHLYQLVLLEFLYIFNQQKNHKLRQKIKKKLLGNVNKDFDELMESIANLVVDCDDYHRIKTQICEFINNHHSKNLLFHEIDDSFYKFDRELFEKIKKMPRDRLYQELYKISRQFVVFGDVSKIKDLDFPNMYVSCQHARSQQTASKSKKNKGSKRKNNAQALSLHNPINQKYCKNHKFVIDKIKLKSILEIVVADILNPIKEKWLFSSVFSDNVISYFKFIRRPDEHITITIED
jgi:hypothetical protein